MAGDSRDGDAERLEAERLTRIHVGAEAERRVRAVDQECRALGLPDDPISVRDAALRGACYEIETLSLHVKARDGLLEKAKANLRQLLEHSAAKDEVVAAARELLSHRGGFNADYQAIAAAVRRLREALARLDGAPPTETRHLTTGEQGIMDSALRRSLRPVGAEPADTGWRPIEIPDGWRLDRVWNQAPKSELDDDWVAELQFGTKNLYVRSTDVAVGHASPTGAVLAAIARIPKHLLKSPRLPASPPAPREEDE